MSKSNDKTVQSYNAHVQDYINGTPQKVEGAVKQWIDESIANLSKDASILEVGSAFGRDADYIESHGFVVLRTDVVPSFVEYLKKQSHEAKLLDALNDELVNKYDLIFADAVLLHFTRKEAQLVIQKFHDALNRGGRFAFTLKQGKGESWSDEKLGAPRYFCYWDEEGIAKLLKQAGFTSIRITNEDNPGHDNAKWLHITASRT